MDQNGSAKPSKRSHKSSKQPSNTKLGRPTKATPELIQNVLDLLADGYTREQACAGSGVSDHQFWEWEKRPEFPNLRARAEFARISALRKAKDQAYKDRLDWKAVAWDLERIFMKQFADPNKAPTLQVNQAFNSLLANDNELADARARLDETIKKEQARLT